MRSLLCAALRSAGLVVYRYRPSTMAEGGAVQVSINAFLRNPPISGRSHQQLYGEFLEMMEYADQNGIARVALAEHHFEDDGYLPSQFVMAGAIAARTKRMEIWFAIMCCRCTIR